jgi:hypothetical protein
MRFAAIGVRAGVAPESHSRTDSSSSAGTLPIGAAGRPAARAPQVPEVSTRSAAPSEST